MNSGESTPSGFFVLRTPLLPFEDFTAWNAGLQAPDALRSGRALDEALAKDRALLRARLQTILERPEVREALFVASPSLHASLPEWLRAPDGERGQKVERTLVRYFARMAGRATPFGLFAGCSLGHLGPSTRLRLDSPERARRHTRLDTGYLSALAEALCQDRALARELVLRPNPSVTRAAGKLRYVEAIQRGDDRTFRLVAVEPTEYLDATLERARAGARLEALAEALVEPEVSREDAAAYVTELLDSQLLVPELGPAVTGPEPAREMAARLRETAAGREAAERLLGACDALDALDATPLGAGSDRYEGIAEQLRALPAPVDVARLFQVDLVKPAPEATLGPEPVAELLRGVELLRRLTPAPAQEGLRKFREAFEARYGDREVPLLEALDEEVGIGFEASAAPSAEASPLLEGLEFPGDEGAGEPWEKRHAVLLRKLQQAARAGTRELILGPDDLRALEAKKPAALPDAFAVMATLEAAGEEALQRGDFRLHLYNTSGPSGARLLGRFCHADEHLAQRVREHLRAEEALAPEAVFAEIVHLPEGRMGNILLRPVLRAWELPYLGQSGAPPEQQLPIEDLTVSVRAGRIALRSKRLDREIVPRLTCAHNFGWRALGVYRFLCTLQSQGVAPVLTWSWGPLAEAESLPRVVSGRVVLSPARWTLGADRLEALGRAKGAERFRAVQALREELGLPRVVALEEGDHVLPVDLDSALGVEMLVHLVQRRPRAQLTELLGADQLCAHGPGGRFVHELIVPFVRRAPAARPARPQPSRAPASRIQRAFPPGSEWLYAKLYCGTASADHLVRQLVSPFVQEVKARGTADGWFFIRYGDPDWHLRLRLHGEPKALQRSVLPALHAQVAPLLEAGAVWKLQLDTYEREVERYGGDEGILLAEQLFQADSEAVAGMLDLLQGEAGANARWQLVLAGMHRLLDDWGLDLAARLAVVTDARQSFGREFQVGGAFERQLGEKYRRERAELEALLEADERGEHPLEPALALLRRRSKQLAPVVTKLKALERAGRLTVPVAGLASSFLHMHANRLLRAAARAQELVVYDFLARLYESRRARASPTRA